MKKYLFILPVIAALFLLGCESKSTSPETENSHIHINNDDFGGRIDYPDDEIIPIYGIDDSSRTAPLFFVGDEEEDEDQYVLMLRAEVDPPELNGVPLRATHVTLEGNYAFVSYNTEGGVYQGGVEVFNIANPEFPYIVSQALLLDGDVSAVEYADNQLFMAGALDMANNPSLVSPAVLEIIPFSNGNLQANTQIIDISSYVATDLALNQDYIFVSSGDNGGISILNYPALDIATETTADDARSIEITDNEIVLLQGTPARLSIYSLDGVFQSTIDIGGANIADSKSDFEITDGLAYIPAGDEGAKVVDMSSGIITESIGPPAVPENGIASDYVTNAISANGQVVFIANGGGGIYLAQWKTNGLEVLGYMDFGSSTNYVKAQNNIIFVATGIGGLKILEMVPYEPEDGTFLTLGNWNNQGRPDYLEDDGDDIDDDYLEHLLDVMPERSNLLEEHPEFFENETANATLQQEADVWVTFVEELAAWRNSLGFYTYDINNPPSGPDDLDNMTIIFPNVSKHGSGGQLRPGDKVYLGSFPTNTVIGFFLVARGWANREVTAGLYTHYSNYQFNQGNQQLVAQNVLLFDETHENLVLSFEDISINNSGSDRDFNDAIFMVTSDPPNAVITDNLPILPGDEDNDD